jgi:light-regulated signal transduction histidine kinase (bacteriophytochrome)
MAESDEQHIAALQAELTGLRTEMQEFTATVSHDLRAPLRHILSYAQLVQEDAGPLLSAEVNEFLTTITDSARHMGVLLDGLTALSRLGVVTVTPMPVSLQSAVQDVCDALSRRCSGRSLEWRLSPDLPMVQADAVLLEQVLVHLVGNAVKFTTPRAHAVIEISALPASDPGLVQLRVRDNGVGYNAALQSRLFKVFGRLHSVQQFEGIGMGLVLSQKTAQRLGGSLAIEGAPDSGCCVTLTLPVN